MFNLSEDDVSEVVSLSFKYGKIVLMSTTYDAGLFPLMENYLCHFKSKGIQNKKIGLVENGSWAPMAAKFMRNMLDGMKNIEICSRVVTIKTSMTDKNVEELREMAKELTE